MYNRLSLHPVWCRVQVTLLINILTCKWMHHKFVAETQSPRVFPRSVGSNLFAWATLVLSNLNQKLGDVSTAISCAPDKSAYVPNNPRVHDYS